MAARNKDRPPKWADRFLGWFCRTELLEEVRGDLHEFYGIEREDKSVFKARISYWFHVLHFLRPFALKRQRQTHNTNNIAMYRSYIKTGLRNLKRQRLASFINVFGLATTIAISLVVYVLLDRQYSLDQFHADAERIYSVQSKIKWNGQEETWGPSPMLLANALQAEVPQIELATRVTRERATVRFDDKVFRELITYADPSYLSLFSFPLSQGNTQALEQKQQVILSQEAADKYFDYGTAVGQEIKVMVNEKPHLFRVAGVAAPFKKTASFEFDFLVSIDHLNDLYGKEMLGWKDLRERNVHTFVKLDHASSQYAFEESLDKFRLISNASNPDWPIDEFQVNALTELAQNSQFVREPYATGSTPQILIMFGIISLLLLTSACFNYVNIAVSMAQKRFNEIAVRKVVGGQRRQLMAQFLTENLILCFIATVVGLFLAIYVMMPGVNAIFIADYSIDLFTDPTISLFLFLLFVGLSLVSGAYPALYVSGFKPVAILGGKQKSSGKKRLSKVLLTAQFFLTFIAIIAGLLFTNITQFQEDRDWGYEAENVLVLPVSTAEQFQFMSNFASQSPLISEWAGSQSLVGISSSQEVVSLTDEKLTVRTFRVGAQYDDLLQIPLRSGRRFNDKLTTDQNSILVNQAFIKATNLKPPFVDQSLKVDDESLTIIGVLEDFHYDDFFNPISPVMMKLNAEVDHRYLSMKVMGNRLEEAEELVKAAWSERFPDSPYTGFFQSEVFDNFYQNTNSLKQIMNFVALVAIVLSIMGLFGLASLMIAKRLKEYSIRKVLGAKGIQIATQVSRQFIGFMVIALLLGVPSSYFGFNVMFSQIFPGTLEGLNALPFLAAIGILLLVILLTISSHIIQLVKMSPVKSLRSER